tara:strand:+ start:1599 stop:2522 length:924 start_codon:yes stop_codon:yes gene_type:complete
MLFYDHHIERTAGTTLGYILRRNYADEYLKIGKKEMLKYFGKARITPLPKPAQINSGELNYIIDQCEKLPKCIASGYISVHSGVESLRQRYDKVKIITLLRDPIARVLSHYFAHRKKYLHLEELPVHIKYDFRNDIKEWIRNSEYSSSKYGFKDYCENRQTYFIDNALNIDDAVLRMKNDFWFVGIVERFDEGLLLLKDQFKKLGKNFNIMYIRQQVVPRSKQDIDQFVTPEVIEKLESMNGLDQQLYEEAKKIFEDRIKTYSGNLESDLFNYRKQLKRWQIYHNHVPLKIREIIGLANNKLIGSKI